MSHAAEIAEYQALYDLQFPQEVHYSKKPVRTNADHIRSMTDEELAAFLECFGACHYCPQYGEASFVDSGIPTCDGDCEQHISDWLKQPYKEET